MVPFYMARGGKMADVVSVGILVADAMGKPIDRIPDEDRLALFDRMELHIGGCAANTGIALKKLGAELPSCPVEENG